MASILRCLSRGRALATDRSGKTTLLGSSQAPQVTLSPHRIISWHDHTVRVSKPDAIVSFPSPSQVRAPRPLPRRVRAPLRPSATSTARPGVPTPRASTRPRPTRWNCRRRTTRRSSTTAAPAAAAALVALVLAGAGATTLVVGRRRPPRASSCPRPRRTTEGQGSHSRGGRTTTRPGTRGKAAAPTTTTAAWTPRPRPCHRPRLP